MSNFLNLPEKRPDIGQVQNPEQPPAKCAKLDAPQPGELDETEMELQISRSEVRSAEEVKSAEEAKSAGGSPTHTQGKFLEYCEICGGHVGHKCWDCPDKSKGMGMGCHECCGPCKKNVDDDDDGIEHWSIEMVKYCIVCGGMGKHWGDDCPFRSNAKVDNSRLSEDEDSFF